MKTGAIVSFFAFIILWSCADYDTRKSNELSPEVKQFLSMRVGSTNGLSPNAMGPINGSFSSLNTFGRFNGRISCDSTNVPGDSTEVPGDSTEVPGDTTEVPGDSTTNDSTIWENPWETCAVYTDTDNPDGSHTWTVDYGDGCWEGWDPWKYFMHGKVSSTYKYTNEVSGSVYSSSYFYKSVYDNYGGFYDYEDYKYNWVVNGFYNYEGESTYNTETQEYNGWYSHSANSEYISDSIPYTYIGEGYSHYDQNKLVVESNNYQYLSGNDYYKTKVLTPLVFDYNCSRTIYYSESEGRDVCIVPFWTYVSGREEITYRYGDNEGTFIIDYGDGTCDNIVTIIENGVSTEIDLSKQWYW